MVTNLLFREHVMQDLIEIIKIIKIILMLSYILRMHHSL